MIKTINNIGINYIQYGNKKGDNVVLLHGWGQNIEMMKPVGDRLSENSFITILDLPGYGKSDIPKIPFTVYDYVEIIKEFLNQLNIKNPVLIGHSFGGKISLLYASMYDTKKLILFASPFKKEKSNNTLKIKLLKSMKKIPVLNKLENFAKKHVGSTDYRNASPIMREILVNTVNLDITEQVKTIKCPTLIVWGTNDQAVDVERAYELEKLISNSGTIIYEGCTHYAYLERLDQTTNAIKYFLNN